MLGCDRENFLWMKVFMNISELMNFYATQLDSKVRGWFYPPDLVAFWIADRIQKDAFLSGNICELGVYQGKSAITLGHMIQSEEILFCFDLFHEYPIDKFRANME